MREASIPTSLVIAAKRGDHDALLRLLVIAQPDIRRFARHSCRRSSDIDDALQDTLWTISKHIGALQSATSFSAWLAMIVRRACLRMARMFVALPPLKHAPANLSERPIDDLRIDLVRAVQSLSNHHREVLLLRDIEECTITEISDRLGLSREAVKGRLHRARLLMREYLISDVT